MRLLASAGARPAPAGHERSRLRKRRALVGVPPLGLVCRSERVRRNADAIRENWRRGGRRPGRCLGAATPISSLSPWLSKKETEAMRRCRSRLVGELNASGGPASDRLPSLLEVLARLLGITARASGRSRRQGGLGGAAADLSPVVAHADPAFTVLLDVGRARRRTSRRLGTWEGPEPSEPPPAKRGGSRQPYLPAALVTRSGDVALARGAGSSHGGRVKAVSAAKTPIRRSSRRGLSLGRAASFARWGDHDRCDAESDLNREAMWIDFWLLVRPSSRSALCVQPRPGWAPARPRQRRIERAAAVHADGCRTREGAGPSLSARAFDPVHAGR